MTLAMQSTKSKRLLAPALVLGAGVLVCGILLLETPTQSPLLPPCVFHRISGVYCPGCGSTRALHALLHGQLAAAIDFNVMMVLFVPVLLGAYARWTVRAWTGNHVPRRPLDHRLIWALAVLVVLYGIARNLPFAPFDALAP